MTQTSLESGVRTALQAIHENRLVLLLGAGLSMPSGLPSAQTLADRAKRTYDLQLQPGEAPLSPDIEKQAEFFYRAGRLETYYIPRLIDKNAFSADPNLGHRAVADFLLTGAVKAAVSTNYDFLIEAAGLGLLGKVESALDGAAAAAVTDGAPLLKIHGCWVIGPRETVWTPEQIGGAGVVSQRLGSSQRWLSNSLADTDLLVVGFWSDWNYLNSVIGASLGQITPARVTLVDPSPSDALRTKAEGLYALGEGARAFQHVQVSGDTFLDELRCLFSQDYVRRTLRAGAASYTARSAGAAPAPEWLEPTFVGNDTLWHVRRDLEGCSPHAPALARAPAPGEALGLTMIELQQHGATAVGPYWCLGDAASENSVLVRVLNGSNRVVDALKAEYDTDMAPVTAPDVVIAVGAEDSPLPGSIARPNPSDRASAVRGRQPRWVTRTTPIASLLATPPTTVPDA